MEEEEKDKKDEEEYVKKDPVQKFQYDYNNTTCMTNKFPEGDPGSSPNFAPAEGKIPSNILKDEDKSKLLEFQINEKELPNIKSKGFLLKSDVLILTKKRLEVSADLTE